MLIWVLYLSDMRGHVDEESVVAFSRNPLKLQEWAESFLVDPYRDEPSADFFGRVHTYQKVFAKGSPLEWFNPPMFNPPMGSLQGIIQRRIPEEDFSDWKNSVRFIE